MHADEDRETVNPFVLQRRAIDRALFHVAAVARGLTNAEIADALHISLSTVKTHLASLMQKLGARNRVEIAMWAHETGRMKS